MKRARQLKSAVLLKPALFNTGIPFGLSLSKPQIERPSTSSARTTFNGRVHNHSHRVMRTAISPGRRQSGATLFTALIFLIILAVFGVNVAQMSTLEERMAGNSRNQDLALQAAEAALEYVEKNLTTGIKIRTLIPVPADTTSGTVTGPGLRAINVCLPNNASYWNGTGAADCNGTTRQFDWSDTTALTAALALNQIAAQPMYVVERMPNEGSTEKYRVTTRAIGGDSNAIVILQALFSVTP